MFGAEQTTESINLNIRIVKTIPFILTKIDFFFHSYHKFCLFVLMLNELISNFPSYVQTETTLQGFLTCNCTP